MTIYACQQCNNTQFQIQMRSCIVMLGPGKELQSSGIVPCRQCMNEKCGLLTVESNLKIGEIVAGIAYMPPPKEEGPEMSKEDLKTKMASLLKMKAQIAEMEDDLVEGEPELPQAPPVEGDEAKTASAS